MRFRLQKKLLLLIAVLSLALIIASVLISSRLYSNNLERNTRGLCSESGDALSEKIEREHADFMSGYQDKIDSVYREHRVVLESLDENSFESFDKRQEFFDHLTEDIFPPKQGMGMSYDMLVFKNEYSQILDQMDILSYPSGLDIASVFYYDQTYGNIVYLFDRQPEGSTRYNFPVSVQKPWDDRLKEALEANAPVSFIDDSTCYGLTPVNGAGENVFVLFGRQTADLEQNVRLFSLYSFVITLGATLIIGLVMLLFANRLIVKNVRKLTEASEKFTSQIDSETPERVSAGITAKDEIGALSSQFDKMQGAILGYVSSLAEKTSAEERMKAELSLAARIQSEALPKGGLKAGAVILDNFLKPAREVGGDLYDYFMLDEKRLFFCLADVSGKGIPASLFMMRAKELIKAGIRAGSSLDEFAFRLNNELCAGNEESIFITAFFGVLDTESGLLSYLRAGQEEPFLRRDGQVTRLGEESNFVLGVFEDAEYQADTVTLEAGDALLVFTDGLNEGINEENEEFGYDRIAEAFRTAQEDIPGVLFDVLQHFCGTAEQFDDVTMLALTFGKTKRIELTDPDYDDITAVTDTILEELQDMEQDRTFEIGLMIDEVMNNQISYAFEQTEQPRLNVILRRLTNDVALTFEDNGTAFDPLTEVTEERLEESEGGYGLMLIRTFSDEQCYERSDGYNRLTIKKHMDSPAQ